MVTTSQENDRRGDRAARRGRCPGRCAPRPGLPRAPRDSGAWIRQGQLGPPTSRSFLPDLSRSPRWENAVYEGKVRIGHEVP